MKRLLIPMVFIVPALLCGCSSSIRSGAAHSITNSQTNFAHRPPAIALFDGFEADVMAAFWKPGNFGSGRFEPGAAAVVNTHARTGRGSVRITVNEGNVEQTGDHDTLTERAELDSGRHPFLGRDVWYGFSFLVPLDFPVVENRLIIAQWKQEGVGSPLIALRYRGGKLYLTISDCSSLDGAKKRCELPDIEFGRWNDMVFHVRPSSKRDGIVEVWMNGVRLVAHRSVTASSTGENQFYNKIGLYRDRWPEPMTIYFDNYALGDSFEAVDPTQFNRAK